jgi:RHS repeat-associated protein
VRRARRPAGLRRAVLLVATLWLPVPALAQTETVEYYALDAVGSVRVVFNPDGTVKGRMDYTPFGGALQPAVGLPPEAFAGLFRDPEAGLDYAQARSYQVRTGRFNRPDPVYAGLFDPQKWNRYAYARNSPLSFTDASGLDPCATSADRTWDPGDGSEGSGSWTCSRTIDSESSGDPEDAHYYIVLIGALQDLDAIRGTPGSGVATTGTATTTGSTTPTGTPPSQTPGNPEAPKPRPGTDCEVFAEQLALVSAMAVGREDMVGWAMMWTAREDPWRGRAVEGFKGNLTRDQGSDVYRHIVGHSGAVLAGRTGGTLAALKEFLTDVGQLARGSLGAPAEVAGDIAGWQVGITMWIGRGNTSWVTKRVTRIICQ